MPVQVTADKLTNLPDELKRLSQWVVWKRETRDGKPTKVPYNANTNGRAITTNAATWASYETACAAVAKRGYDGLGIAFASPYCGIDLDKCRDAATGIVEPWADTIIKEANSYTEVSPSGTGFHILLKGAIPVGGNRRGRVEMYHQGRYFCVTGDHLEGTPLTIEARDLSSLHARMLSGELEGGSEDKPHEVMAAMPSRDDLIAGRGYADKSRADFALCVMLAADHNGDAVKIDAAFRTTALLRPKWDEMHGATTYGARTIERAIEHWRNKGAICTVEVEEPAAGQLVPVYPAHTLDGDYIGQLVRILTDGTGIPPQFVRENVKCILGAIIDSRVGFPGHAGLHLRHYTVNISPYQRTGKGESWNLTGDEFKEGVLVELLKRYKVEVVDGGWFGSGEFMASKLCELEERRSPSDVLVRFDEMFEPFEKAKALGSTLESKLLQLYERNTISSGSFKNGSHEARNTHLSLSGDFTYPKFLETFEGRGSGGSGFLARCTLAFADKIYLAGDWAQMDKIAAHKVITDIAIATDTLRNTLGVGRFVPAESPAARDLRLAFFERLRTKEDPRYTPELESHFKRDLLMRAVFSRDMRLDEEHVRKSIDWTLHQLELRNELWPVDAGGPVERAEQRIVKTLAAKGTLTLTRLADFCHVRRPGSGGFDVFNRALKALTFGQVIRVIDRSQRGSPIYALEGGSVNA